MKSRTTRNADAGPVGVTKVGSMDALCRGMRWQCLIAASLAIVLSACAPATSSAASPATGAEAAACPFATFDDFIQRFSRDMSFQQRATADPLVVAHYDTAAEPEPRRVESDVALADVAWPVMPSFERLAASGRTHTITSGVDRRMDVMIRRPDTSDQQIYVFGQTPCWQLQRVIDESI